MTTATSPPKIRMSWSKHQSCSDDTRANGTVVVDTSLSVPVGFGCTSVSFTTGASTPSPSTDKAQLINFALAERLVTIYVVSFWAFRSFASVGGPAIDLSLNVSITGASVPGYAVRAVQPERRHGRDPRRRLAAVERDRHDDWKFRQPSESAAMELVPSALR
jgi:hypothetical protein